MNKCSKLFEHHSHWLACVVLCVEGRNQNWIIFMLTLYFSTDHQYYCSCLFTQRGETTPNINGDNHLLRQVIMVHSLRLNLTSKSSENRWIIYKTKQFSVSSILRRAEHFGHFFNIHLTPVKSPFESIYRLEFCLTKQSFFWTVIRFYFTLGCAYSPYTAKSDLCST